MGKRFKQRVAQRLRAYAHRLDPVQKSTYWPRTTSSTAGTNATVTWKETP